MSKQNLLPRPFCGGKAKEKQTAGSFGGYGSTSIYCQNYSASTKTARQWNRRAR